jgi:signal transduction histidine kinase/ligand-binding sensor domain-containing protein
MVTPKRDSSVFTYFRLVFLCSFLCGMESFSHAQDISFSHVTTDHGLLSGNVRAIAEDYQGFFWIGTEDGLQRYDGYSMSTYKYNELDTTSISGNVVLNIFEDHLKNLWIGTMNGLCLYDRKNNRFKRFKHNPSDSHSINGNIIRAIFESKDGTLYFGFDDSGVSYCKISTTSPDTVVFTSFDIPHGEDNSLQGWVSSICEDEDGKILLGGQGLFRFNPSSRKITQLLTEIFFDEIHNITIDSHHRIWLVTYGQGIYIYNRSFKLLVHHASKAGLGYLSSNQADKVLEDPEGNFWITTDAGLNLISAGDDPLSDKPFKVYVHKENEPNSLLSNSIKAAILDRNNRLWLGSYFGGLNIYNKYAFKFQPIKSSKYIEGSLSDGNVFGFEYDNNDNLWIGTDGDGLNILKHPKENLFQNKYERFELKVGARVIQKIKVLKIDREHSLWVGTWGDGMFKIDLSTKKYEQFVNIPNDDQSLIGNEVMQLAVDSLDNLWIGTFSGLDCYNLKTKIFTHYKNLNIPNTALQVDRITAIHSHRDHLWIAHEVFGLYEFNHESKSFVKFNIAEISEGISINTIHHDEHGFLWLGTNSNGLIRYNTVTKETKVFDEKSELANNIVNAILQESKNGRLWLSTNNGLTEFNQETETFTNYTKADGLQGAQFNPNSAYSLNDGLMLFGGTSGFNAFNPKIINKSNKAYPIVFTRFWLGGSESNVGDVGSPLTRNILVSDTIILSHTQNSFSLEFAMLEYSFSNRNHYQYFMQGLHDQWQDSNLDNKAIFTNLDPGTYVLKIKASNSDGIWSDSIKSLVIDIRPAWWQTTAFKMVVGMLLVILTYSIFWFRLRYLLSMRKRLELQVKERTLEIENINKELAAQIQQVRLQNLHIAEKNSEISAQNEELISQHDQIIEQREELERSQAKLKEVNENLEELVNKRTQKLKETITVLDKTVAELDRFVYSASHDLSAPLKSVLGLINLVRNEKDPALFNTYYDYMEKSISNLDQVILSLVNFARNSHQDIVITTIHLYQFVNEIFQEFAFWPEAARIQFQNLIDKTFTIETDKDRLKVILHNIIANGIKYSDSDKPQPYLRIEAYKDGSYDVIQITDNGIGIKKEYQDKIFDMYFRASDQSKGSGLGLFIVKEIAAKINASITAKSVHLEGSSFTIRLKEILDLPVASK